MTRTMTVTITFEATDEQLEQRAFAVRTSINQGLYNAPWIESIVEKSA